MLASLKSPTGFLFGLKICVMQVMFWFLLKVSELNDQNWIMKEIDFVAKDEGYF